MKHLFLATAAFAAVATAAPAMAGNAEDLAELMNVPLTEKAANFATMEALANDCEITVPDRYKTLAARFAYATWGLAQAENQSMQAYLRAHKLYDALPTEPRANLCKKVEKFVTAF